MNYIWELAIRALNKGIDPDLITYICQDNFSPYMELSFPNINESDTPLLVEINPYYRYHSIFKLLLDPDLDFRAIIDMLLDLTIHHLCDIDVHMGMNRREYYISFIIRDLERGYYGNRVQEGISVFQKDELVIVANCLIALHMMGEGIFLLKESVRLIFKGAYIFSNAEERDEIVFFLKTNKTEAKERKMDLLQYLFAPFKCTSEIYWERIFGIMDVPEMMVSGEMMLY